MYIRLEGDTRQWTRCNDWNKRRRWVGCMIVRSCLFIYSLDLYFSSQGIDGVGVGERHGGQYGWESGPRCAEFIAFHLDEAIQNGLAAHVYPSWPSVAYP